MNVRAAMEGVDDTAMAEYVAAHLEAAPVLFRGIARYQGAADEVWAAATEGEPLNLSPWSYACFTETFDEAVDWAAYNMGREGGLELTVVMLLDGVGARMTDGDGVMFAEWLVPNDGPVVVAKTSATVARHPVFMRNEDTPTAARLVVCRKPRQVG